MQKKTFASYTTDMNHGILTTNKSTKFFYDFNTVLRIIENTLSYDYCTVKYTKCLSSESRDNRTCWAKLYRMFMCSFTFFQNFNSWLQIGEKYQKVHILVWNAIRATSRRPSLSDTSSMSVAKSQNSSVRSAFTVAATTSTSTNTSDWNIPINDSKLD